MQDNDELFDNYIQQEFNGYFRLEGTEGVRNLEKLCEGLGYRDGQFIGQHYILNFLADNPGAIEKLFEFIQEGVSNPYNTEWAEALDLESYAHEEEDETTEH
jgi:hypothetical protein